MDKKGYTIQLPVEIVNRLHCVKKLKKGQIDIGAELAPIILKALKDIEYKNKIFETTWKDIKKCPKCDSYLVKKKGKSGFFYGCYDYPNCKHTEQIVNNKNYNK